MTCSWRDGQTLPGKTPLSLPLSYTGVNSSIAFTLRTNCKFCLIICHAYCAMVTSTPKWCWDVMPGGKRYKGGGSGIQWCTSCSPIYSEDWCGRILAWVETGLPPKENDMEASVAGWNRRGWGSGEDEVWGHILRALQVFMLIAALVWDQWEPHAAWKTWAYTFKQHSSGCWVVTAGTETRDS